MSLPELYRIAYLSYHSESRYLLPEESKEYFRLLVRFKGWYDKDVHEGLEKLYHDCCKSPTKL